MRMNGAPQSYLSAMLNLWVHWAPGDGRGSKDYARLGHLQRAIHRMGYPKIAEKLNLEDDDDDDVYQT